MQHIDHQDFEGLIEQYYDTKLPLFCYGGYGIGKSQTVKRKAKDLAEKQGREFIEWNETDLDKKEELIEHPSKYFVLMDIRLAQFDPSDLKGMPKLDANKVVDWLPLRWIYFSTRPEADGLQFFDEANNAPPSVQKAFYQVVYDRQCSEYSLSENIGMVAAGNRSKDRSNVFEIPQALKDRYGEVELDPPDIEQWTKWASHNGIDSRIIGFLSHRTEFLHNPDPESRDKGQTPRGWERASKLISEEDPLNDLRIKIGSAVGTGVSKEFVAFAKLREKISIEETLKNPGKANIPEEMDRKWSFVSEIAHRYRKEVDKRDRGDITDHDLVELIDKLFQLFIRLSEKNDEEFGSLLLHLAKHYEENVFTNLCMKAKHFETVSDKWSRLKFGT